MSQSSSVSRAVERDVVGKLPWLGASSPEAVVSADADVIDLRRRRAIADADCSSAMELLLPLGVDGDDIWLAQQVFVCLSHSGRWWSAQAAQELRCTGIEVFWREEEILWISRTAARSTSGIYCVLVIESVEAVLGLTFRRLCCIRCK